MPRKNNPYGYTVNEQRLERDVLRWDSEESAAKKLPAGSRKIHTKNRGDRVVLTEKALINAAAEEAMRVAGISKEDVQNVIAAYKNVAMAAIGNGVDVDLLGISKIKVNLNTPTEQNPQRTSKSPKRLTTSSEDITSGLARLGEERPDLTFTPNNWYTLLFEHGSHIPRTPGKRYKERDAKRAEGRITARRGERTYQQALNDLKVGRTRYEREADI